MICQYLLRVPTPYILEAIILIYKRAPTLTYSTIQGGKKILVLMKKSSISSIKVS